MRHLSALILAGTTAMTGYAFADTISVCESGCDFTTISAAVNAASDGDTITIAAGDYTWNVAEAAGARRLARFRFAEHPWRLFRVEEPNSSPDR